MIAPRPHTQSQPKIATEPIGTIVRRRFEDNKYYEGEVIKYNAKDGFYTVRYQDGDIEEYDIMEMSRFKKKTVCPPPPKHSAFLLEGKGYD